MPMLFWLSPGYVKANNINLQCLQTKGSTAEVSQDNLFHTVLDVMNVQTHELDPQLDILHDCKN